MHITPDSLIDDIEGFTLGGRSLQVEIGVSEIGMSCRRCVARKMAEYEKTRLVSSFRTTIGRYFHEGVANDLEKKYEGTGALLIENGLLVHSYKGWTLRGSCDIFAPNRGHGMVLDWKCVGDDTLEKTRKAVAAGGTPKEQYTIQGQLYALGWELLGYAVEDICILFVPANKGDLRRYHVPYRFAYDRTVALKALALVEDMIDKAEAIGWEATVRSFETESGCLSCPQYVGVDNPQYDFLSPEKRALRQRTKDEWIRQGQPVPR